MLLQEDEEEEEEQKCYLHKTNVKYEEWMCQKIIPKKMKEKCIRNGIKNKKKKLTTMEKR